MNHSPKANAAYYDDLTFSALRDIQPGEEITHNYTGCGEDEDCLITEDDWTPTPEVSILEVSIPEVSIPELPTPIAKPQAAEMT